MLSVGQAVAGLGLEHAPLCGKGGEGFAEALGAHARSLPQFLAVEGDGRGGEGLLDSLAGGGLRLAGVEFFVGAIDHVKGGRGTLGSELEDKIVGGGSGAVLDAEVQGVPLAAQVKVRVSPCVELGGAPQSLPGAEMGRALARVVDQEDSRAEAALKPAQEAEKRRHLGGGVLIDAVQAHEGIEDEEPRVERRYGVAESEAVIDEVESQAWDADHVDVEAIERDAGRLGEALQAIAHQGQSILGREQQHRAGLLGREAAQAGGAGGDRDGEVESEEGLAESCRVLDYAA